MKGKGQSPAGPQKGFLSQSWPLTHHLALHGRWFNQTIPFFDRQILFHDNRRSAAGQLPFRRGGQRARAFFQCGKRFPGFAVDKNKGSGDGAKKYERAVQEVFYHWFHIAFYFSGTYERSRPQGFPDSDIFGESRTSPEKFEF